MDFENINLLAVGIAALANTIIGALWFNAPFLFNAVWLAGINKTADTVAAQASPLKPLSALVGAVVSAFVLAVFLNTMGITTLVDGAFAGLLVGGAFASIPAMIKDTFEGRPIPLTLINAGHDLVIFTLMGAIIGAL